MFYCETCRLENNWPTSFGQSRGRCECCGDHTSCWDRPASSLPRPVTTNRPSGRYDKNGKLISADLQIKAVNVLMGMIGIPKPAPEDEEDDSMSTNKTLLERLRTPCGKVTGHGDHCVKGYTCETCSLKALAALEIERLTKEGRERSAGAAINLNDQFRATLTATGAKLRNEFYEDMRITYPSVAPKRNEAGDVVVEQLWEMMRIYGPAMFNGMGEVPFEKNQIVSTFWD